MSLRFQSAFLEKTTTVTPANPGLRDRPRAGGRELSDPPGIRWMGIKTILENRTFRGGVLADGASLMKAGENGGVVAQ